MRAFRQGLALLISLYLALGPGAGRALAALDAETTTNSMNSGHSSSGSGIPSSGLESFKTDLATGSASFSIPIEVPPGTAGMQPSLALAYSSGAGNGWAGFGWMLDLGKISRRTQHGVPKYNSGDEFQLDSTRLVIGADSFYHTEVESFVRIAHVTTGGKDQWEVTSKDGKKLYFGQSLNSRISRADGMIFAWLLDRVEDNFQNALRVTYYEDSSTGDGANRYPQQIIYTYHGASPGQLVGGSSGERRVDFCLEGTTDACLPPTLTTRPDSFTSYQSGFKLQTTRRLKSIRTYFGNLLVRRYNLSYLDPSGGSARSRLASVQAKGSDGTTAAPPMTFTYSPGASGYGTVQDWVNPSDNGAGSHLFSMRTQTSGGESESAVLDMDADGVADRVTVFNDTYWKVWRAIPGGVGYGVTSSNWAYHSGLDESSYFTMNLRDTISGDVKSEVIDLNGDGRPDRVTRNQDNNTSWNVYWNSSNNGFDPKAAWPNPSYDPNIQKYNSIRHTQNFGNEVIADVLDMDGDGLPDRVVQDPDDEYNWKVYKNLGGTSGFSSTVANWNNRSPHNHASIQERNNNGVVADVIDLNGDGLPDRVIAVHNDQYWHAWFNTGSEFENVERLWNNPSYLDDNSYESIRTLSGDKSRADLEDVNGDGLLDRITEGPTAGGVNKFKVYLNTGTGFSTSSILWTNPSNDIEPRETQGNSTIADLMDVNGDGLADRVMYDGAQGHWQFCRYPSTKPDLLAKVENGLGGSIEIAYQASTQYLDGTARANPDLPFPVQTVKEVRRRDGISGYNDILTTYMYEGGFYEHASREFRGFYLVTASEWENTSTDDDEQRTVTAENAFPAASPKGTQTITVFHQGDDEQLKGQVESVEVYDLAAPQTALSTVVNEYKSSTDGDYTTIRNRVGPNVQIALLKRTFATVAATPSAVSTAVSFTYDTYGNVKEQREEGIVGVSGDERRTCTDYAAPGADYRAAFPTKVFVTADDACASAAGAQILSQTSFAYDQATDPKGFWLSRADRLRDGIQTERDVVTYRTRDDYGNVRTISTSPDQASVDPPPHWRTTTFTYDGEAGCPGDSTTTTHTFACRVENALGHQSDAYYKPGLGVAFRQVDPNGHATVTEYDQLGRATRVSFLESGQSSAVTLREYSYPTIGGGTNEGKWGDPTGTTGAAQNVRTIDYATPPTSSERNYGLESRVFFDGFGRTTSVRSDGDDQKPVLTKSDYDNRGRVETRGVPYFDDPPGAPSPGATLLSYDPLGRVIRVQHPKNNCTLTSYNGLNTTVELRQTCGASTVTQRRGTTRDAYRNVREVREYNVPEVAPGTSSPYITTYRYDALDNLIEVKDACAQPSPPSTCNTSQSHVTTIQYDTLSRKIQASDPDMGIWFYSYDDVGNLKTQTDAKGETITFFYDDLDRVELKDYSTAQPDVVFRYDGEDDSDATNPIGRLTGVTDSAGNLKYGYDLRGNLVRFIRDYPAINKRFEYGYHYDNLNRLTEIEYPKQPGGVSPESIGTLSLRYTDSSNRQTPHVQEVLPDPSWPITDLVKQGTKYDAFGNLAEYTDGSNIKTTLTHDTVSGEMTENKVVPAAGGATISDQKYYYNAATRFIDHVQNVGNELTDQYFVGSGNVPGYDALGRLRASHGPWLPVWPPPLAVNTYDPIGNILTKDVIDGNEAISKELSYTDVTNPTAPHTVRKLNTADDSLIRTYSYDDNGNMATRITGATTRAFVWNQDNRLIRVNENGVTLRDFVYDFTGERVIAAAYNQGQTLYMPTRDFEWSSSHQDANVFVFLGSTRVAVVGLSFTPESIPVGGWAKFRELMDAAGTAAAGLSPLLLMLLALGLLRWWIRPGRAPVTVLARRAGIGVLVLVFLNATARPARAVMPPYAGSVNQILFYHGDYKGSESLIFAPNQDFVQGIDYWPFGAVRANLVNGNYLVDVRHKFTDQELENDLGLYYYGGRWYDPETGRFISPDPFVQAPKNPQNLNRYSYVVNNPTNLVDPSGNFFLLLAVAAAIYSAYQNISAGIESARSGHGFFRGYFRSYAAQAAGFAAGLIGGVVAGPILGAIGGVLTSVGVPQVVATAISAVGSVAAAGAAGGVASAAVTGGDLGQAAVWGAGTAVAFAVIAVVAMKVGQLVSNVTNGGAQGVQSGEEVYRPGEEEILDLDPRLGPAVDRARISGAHQKLEFDWKSLSKINENYNALKAENASRSWWNPTKYVRSSYIRTNSPFHWGEDNLRFERIHFGYDSGVPSVHWDPHAPTDWKGFGIFPHAVLDH